MLNSSAYTSLSEWAVRQPRFYRLVLTLGLAMARRSTAAWIVRRIAHMFHSMVFDPRWRRVASIVAMLLLIVLSACQNNTSGGGGGGGGPGY
jgi:hypothetical protein